MHLPRWGKNRTKALVLLSRNTLAGWRATWSSVRFHYFIGCPSTKKLITRDMTTQHKKKKRKQPKGACLLRGRILFHQEMALARDRGKGNEIRSCYKCSHSAVREAEKGNLKLILQTSCYIKFSYECVKRHKRDRQTGDISDRRLATRILFMRPIADQSNPNSFGNQGKCLLINATSKVSKNRLRWTSRKISQSATGL